MKQLPALKETITEDTFCVDDYHEYLIPTLS